MIWLRLLFYNCQRCQAPRSAFEMAALNWRHSHGNTEFFVGRLMRPLSPALQRLCKSPGAKKRPWSPDFESAWLICSIIVFGALLFFESSNKGVLTTMIHHIFLEMLVDFRTKWFVSYESKKLSSALMMLLSWKISQKFSKSIPSRKLPDLKGLLNKQDISTVNTGETSHA